MFAYEDPLLEPVLWIRIQVQSDLGPSDKGGAQGAVGERVKMSSVVWRHMKNAFALWQYFPWPESDIQISMKGRIRIRMKVTSWIIRIKVMS